MVVITLVGLVLLFVLCGLLICGIVYNTNLLMWVLLDGNTVKLLVECMGYCVLCILEILSGIGKS